MDGDVIGKIDLVFPVDEQFILVDRQNVALYGYQQNGAFLFKLDGGGRGPGEFTYIQDVQVDYQQKGYSCIRSGTPKNSAVV